jgi:hypothetical protein
VPSADPRNPYRPDLPASDLFTGRAEERRRLREALGSGTPGVVAVMGGRGMGKTTLARTAEADAAASVQVAFVARPKEPRDVLNDLGDALGGKLNARMLSRSIVQRIQQLRRPVALVIDEVEGLLQHEHGADLLENLRVAREDPRVGILLRVVVLGGSKLRDLLQSELSPFLRSAHWLPVRSSDAFECKDLICGPLSVDVEDRAVRRLWHNTGGHPLLLQRTLSHAVELGWPTIDHLERAEQEIERQQGPLFEMLWRNLREEGQAAYWELLARGDVPKIERLARFGNNPDATVEVLASTGVVWVDSLEETRVHGGMFERWVRANHTPPELGVLGHQPTQHTTALRSRVRRGLCALFPTPGEIAMIAKDAGLRTERVNFNGSAEQVWELVLDEVDRVHGVGDLRRAVQHQYPKKRTLLQLLTQLAGAR